MLHKSRAPWAKKQTITHFRNELRKKSIDWLNTVEDFGIDVNFWQNIQTQFEIVYHPKPRLISILSVLFYINQKPDKLSIQYYSSENIFFAELKCKSNLDQVVIALLAFAHDHQVPWRNLPKT